MPKCKWDKDRKTWVMQAYKNKKRKVFYSATKGQKGKQEIMRAYYEWIEGLEAPNRRTVAEAWAEYIEYYGQNHKASTTDALNQQYKTYIKPVHENKIIGTLRKSDWQECIDAPYKDRTIAYNTIKRLITSIKHFCIFCAGKGYMTDDNVPLFLLNPAKKEQQQRRALYPDELNRLLQSDSDDWYLEVYQFLVYTGLRRGELCALQIKRDYAMPYIHVRESVSQLSTGMTVGKPKSGKERDEFLIPQAVECIHRHNLKRIEKGFNEDYLFVSSTGGRINPNVLSDRWRDFRSKNGLDNITLHELRHTYATYTSKQVKLEELKKLLGHSKDMNTLGTYVHEIPLTEEEQKAKYLEDKMLAEKVEEIFDIFRNNT